MQLVEEILHSKLFWLTAIAFCVYFYFKYVVYNFWTRRKIPHDNPTPLLGNVPLSYFWGKISHGELIRKSYDKYKKHRVHGVYILHEPHLVVNDPELIRLILAKNFPNFMNHGVHCSETKDPLSYSLPRQQGDKWKRLRSKLSPAFTSGKLKQMYPLLGEICEELLRVMDDSLRESEVIEVTDLISRFTLDCISSIAFGFNCNSLQHPENEFNSHGKISTDFGRVFVLLTFYVPSLMKFYTIPEKRKKVQVFFVDLFNKMVSYRQTEKVTRNDFLNLLMQLMDNGEVEKDDSEDLSKSTDPRIKSPITDNDRISMMEAVAQSVIFIGAGHKTTASAVSCCLYELALNQYIQDKLLEEIRKVSLTPGGLTFEKLFEMKYLDMVFCETLRKYPPAAVTNRVSAEDFELTELKFRISKGMKLAIPIEGLHSDPEIYPNPEIFDPERFTSENKSTRHPFAYLPFSEGPRQCIGKRLAILKAKIAIHHLVLNYRFSASDKTRDKLKFSNNAFVQEPADGIYLKVEKRT